MLPKQAIEEFKTIYEQEEGVKLSNEEAITLANNLMGLFRKVGVDNFKEKGNNEVKGI